VGKALISIKKPMTQQRLIPLVRKTITLYRLRVLKLLMDFDLYILRQQKDPCKAHRITQCKTRIHIRKGKCPNDIYAVLLVLARVSDPDSSVSVFIRVGFRSESIFGKRSRIQKLKKSDYNFEQN